jgi:hypothetical protein
VSQLDPQDPTPGVYYGLSPEEYDAIEAHRSSALKKALVSPNHYRQYRREQDEGREVKGHFEAGHILHDALLQPDDLDHTYKWYDATKSRNTKTYEAWKADNDGAIGILPTDLEMVASIRKQVERHPVLRHMFKGADSEVTIVWEEGGQLFKCKIDYLREFEDGFVIIDLKSVGGRTTAPASERQFRRTIASLDYEMSAQMYRRGARSELDKPVLDYIFAVVEKNPPYNVAAHTIDEDFMRLGDAMFEQARDVVLRLEMDPDMFGGYSTEISALSPPNWKKSLYELD